jgi:V/A-type H+-transporting ATPase subunit D
MTTVRGLPPGRAGRVWLERRIEVAERGTRLLETKLRILAAEEQRFSLLVQRTRRTWESSVAEADLWMSRARLLSARRGARFASPSASAQVDVRWQATMGVRFPSGARARPGEPEVDAPTPDCSALALARQAYAEALRAGAEYAAAEAALDAVHAEVRATRRRLRALERRWTPMLTDARRSLADRLEESEREDGVRLRWAAGRLTASLTKETP